MIVNFAPIAVLALVAVAACWFDITERRIPNWLVLATLAGGLLFAAAGPEAGALVPRLIHAAIALIIGMGLYAIRLIGAGDAKFYAAVAGWFNVSEGLGLLVAVSLVGAVFALGWIIMRRLRPNRAPAADNPDRAKLPFGVAISLGALAEYAALLMAA